MARKLLRNPAGKLLFEDPGDPLYLESGSGPTPPGPPQDCPSDCSSCTGTWQLTISGFTGSCAYQNGTFDTFFQDGCGWLFDDFTTRLECNSQYWQIVLPEGGDTFQIGPNTDGCPPDSGSGSESSGAPACSGQTFSWTFTKL